MSQLSYKQKPVFIGHAIIKSVTEEDKRWKLEVFDYNFHVYRTYCLPKKNVKRKPGVGDYIRTYEIPTEIVGCDINCNTIWDPKLRAE